MVFNRQYDHICLLHSGKRELFQLTRYKKTYEEKSHLIVFNLKRKLNFYELLFCQFFLDFFFRTEMSNDPVRMFKPNADPSVKYDFAGIDSAKKKEFVEKAFAVQWSYIEQMPDHWIQELFLYTLEKGYRNYREKMIAELSDQKLNYIEF